jgi:hypothetical protein
LYASTVTAISREAVLRYQGFIVRQGSWVFDPPNNEGIWYATHVRAVGDPAEGEERFFTEYFSGPEMPTPEAADLQMSMDGGDSFRVGFYEMGGGPKGAYFKVEGSPETWPL